MKKRNKIILILFIVFAAGAAGIYFYTFHKPHQNTFNLKAQYELSADALLTDFETNEVEANSKYLGKIIQVSGTILNISNFTGNTQILFIDEMSGVSCLIDSSYAIQQPDMINKLKIGDLVQIKGQCNGFNFGVGLDRCILVDSK